jgi:siroheme synthase-like protein
VTSRFGYPVSLDVTGKRAVVYGREAVAQGKAEALQAAGAVVTVIEGRALRPEDLDGAFVCVASSPDPEERDALARACRRRGVLVNVMDDPANCDFAAPAVVRRGDLTIAVGTSGRSPAMARKLREMIDQRFGPEWAEVVRVIGDVREETNPELPDLPTRVARWKAALKVQEVVELVREGRAGEARQRLREWLLEVPVG